VARAAFDRQLERLKKLLQDRDALNPYSTVYGSLCIGASYDPVACNDRSNTGRAGNAGGPGVYDCVETQCNAVNSALLIF
jgi:hypothetical protein